EDFEDYEFD
nr:Chain S, C4 peptide [synthetic construct]3AP1_T Chain T, C4 peptide [synthetic construct]3AP2_S Chain S, C4 peptide [synthetic construct]3AP2_T Chain T, C4 peptide [synthetic construct]